MTPEGSSPRQEDRAPLVEWQQRTDIPIHLWHLFYDAAYGLSLTAAQRLVAQGLIQPTDQVFQAPGGATTRKTIYKFYYLYGYPLAASSTEPELRPDKVVDKNGHILPYVRFEGGDVELTLEAMQQLDALARPAPWMRKRQMGHRHQRLPASGPAREALREKGQFWTPPWVADAMVAYALSNGASELFDPAVGAGVFFLAGRNLAQKAGRPLRLRGTEIDKQALEQALACGLTRSDLSRVTITDFVLKPPSGPFEAIVANPPYIRRHRLSLTTKAALRRFCAGLMGRNLDGRTGYHVFFLLRALQLLKPGGRLAFIMPADTCEGVFAPALWRWIAARFHLEAVVTFAADATPFPGVDTNALVFMIQNASPKSDLAWVRCEEAETPHLADWVKHGFGSPTAGPLKVCSRSLHEALATGLSRPPAEREHEGPTLGDVARVTRGIATGANEFFFLTRERIHELRLPRGYFVPAVGRTRDVRGGTLTADDLDALDAAGRPTMLLSIGNEPWGHLPPALRSYLQTGIDMGLPQRTLISTRRPWYRMEIRKIPPILFAYLGRRNARFIHNQAGVVPLTGFLCVYPHDPAPGAIRRLWSALADEEVLKGLALVGKSYGSGAVKVEPRGLEKLPLPVTLLGKGKAPLRTARGTQQEIPYGS